MVFGAPIFLFALAGLAVPLLIHLWSKNTKQNIAFGSIQFLKETDTKSTKNFFPSELLLLILRMLLLACLILILAEPKIESKIGKRVAYLLDPRDRDLKDEIVFSLPENAKTYWLSTHHQALEDEPMPPTEIWTSLASFDAFDSLVVYSSRAMSGFHSERPDELPAINWVGLPFSPVEEPIISLAKSDSAVVLKYETSEEATRFHFSQISNSSAEELVIKIYIHQSDKYGNLGKLIHAAIASMNQLSWVTFQVLDFESEGQLADDDWLIWLSDEEPKWRKNLIYVQPQLHLFSVQSEKVYALDCDADLDEMIHENFPSQLEAAFLNSIRLEFNDLRQMPLSQLDVENVKSSSTKAMKSVVSWFWVAFLILLALERIFSHLKMTNRNG